MKKLLFISLLVLSTSSLYAQRYQQNRNADNRPVRQRVMEFKMAYITETLALSKQDSARFWPVYQQYDQERIGLRRELQQLTRGAVAKSDDQLKKDMETMLTLKEKEVQLERAYMGKFLGVISVRQLAALYYAENQVRRRLIERFGDLPGEE